MRDGLQPPTLHLALPPGTPGPEGSTTFFRRKYQVSGKTDKVPTVTKSWQIGKPFRLHSSHATAPATPPRASPNGGQRSSCQRDASGGLSTESRHLNGRGRRLRATLREPRGPRSGPPLPPRAPGLRAPASPSRGPAGPGILTGPRARGGAARDWPRRAGGRARAGRPAGRRQ